MKNVCVFCGSYSGGHAVYADAARSLAATLVRHDLGLVYGGGRVGLMGVIADEVLRLGGSAIGVIPKPLWDREVGHSSLTEVRIVDTMHERKTAMFELSDAFVAMPGGLGTLEEIFEVWTWAQLGMHQKPVGFLNTAGYYSKLFDFLDHTVAERFVRAEMRRIAILESEPERLVEHFDEYIAPTVPKWIDEEKT